MAAMVTMNASVRRYSRPNGDNSQWSMMKLAPQPSVSTKVVAAPMPTAVSSFFDTPMNGHRPRMRTKTTLLTRTVPRMIKK